MTLQELKTFCSLLNFINKADIKAIYDEVAATKLEDSPLANKTQSMFYNSIDKLNTTLKENTTLRKRLIEELDVLLSELFYQKIEYIIKNKLAEYSNEMLTEEIYHSVGEDLNMIRINGSLVGGNFSTLFMNPLFFPYFKPTVVFIYK